MVRCQCSVEVNGPEIGRGLVNGLLIAIPLWVILGVALTALFDLGPMGETGSATLMIASAWEAMLLRPYLRTLKTQFRILTDACRADIGRRIGRLQAGWVKRRLGVGERPQGALENISGRKFQSIEDLLRFVEPKAAPLIEARPAIAPQALLRQSLALGALVTAYLQYYFLEVNLQIASLHSVTIFVPLVAMT